ncbi:MAG: 16S rRNA (uracil(1498)-N(3))-methyltransferase [Clostridia bacterium]|nr:16S rRNA (uracil(1498)-N(3))-methyltransferase [Clostridia bacterium]
MPHFFEKVEGNEVLIKGENANHIKNSLRMKLSEKITLCDKGLNYECEIKEICADGVKVAVLDVLPNISEPDVQITLYQCLPKGEKFEFVIQKAVELGVSKIVPVLSSRCVSRPDEKKAKKKNERYNKIALSACEQSGRGKKIEIANQIDFKTAVENAKLSELVILFYEGGGDSLKQIVKEQKNIAIFIGPEGGFSQEEVEILEKSGAKTATLGKRILRTETAPLAALTAIMLLTDNM